MYKSTCIRYKHLFLAAALLISTCLPACAQNTAVNNKQINFIEDAWPEALKQAAAQKKYIFVDAYATWCGPCKMLKATTFKNNKAAEFFNKNFINIAIDMEKGMGPQLAARWRLQAYPTLIVFDDKGKPVLGTMGYMGAKDLIKFGEQALSKKSE